jgi:hypothetical protein
MGGQVLLCAGRETDGGEVKSGVSFEAGAPLAFFEFRSGSVVPSVPDTVTADGQRVLLNTLVDESGGAPLTVEIN